MIQTKYLDTHTGKEYTQTNKRGDIPENGCENLVLDIEDDDKILQIILQKDKNNFIRFIEFHTNKTKARIGEIEDGTVMFLRMEHEEER